MVDRGLPDEHLLGRTVGREGTTRVVKDPAAAVVNVAYVGAAAWLVTSVLTGVVLMRLLGDTPSVQLASDKEGDEMTQ